MSFCETIENAFLEVWKILHPEGKPLDPEVVELARRYFHYAHASGKDIAIKWAMDVVETHLGTRNFAVTHDQIRAHLKTITI